VAQVIDDDGQDISEFLVADDPAAVPAAALAAAQTGGKRAAETAAAYISSSSSDDDNEPAQVSAAAVDKKTPQLIFCSRTHSQLSQFVRELHRTRFADSMTLVALASRKALCTNQEVGSRLKAASMWHGLRHQQAAQQTPPAPQRPLEYL
jgi:hypothetical protein